LGKIFTEGILEERGRRHDKIQEAVERYEYARREVADYLDLHFMSVNRILPSLAPLFSWSR
jgi:hypothetical protein